MKKPTLIFTHGGGRLGNQLINFAHLYSFWLEYKSEIDVINMGFWPYADLFELTYKNPSCVFSLSGNKYKSYELLNDIYNGPLNKNRRYLNQFLRLIHFWYCLSPSAQSIRKGEVPNFLKYLTGKTRQDFDLDSTSSVALIKSRKKSAVAGWPVRSWRLFEKYKDVIKEDLQFSREYKSAANDYISKLRKDADFVIGVFIRQGDYKYWFDGRYYFEIPFYKRIMAEITESYKNKKICFVIASDDVQNISDFGNMNVHLTTGSIAMGGHFVESLAELALCDLIISPPSTFSIWASFSGSKPLLPLISEIQSFNETDIVYKNFLDALNHPHLKNSIK